MAEHLFAQALAPLGLTHKDVRVITPYVGGGFGGKAGVSCEILAAALATTVKGQPVKVMWSRAQEFYNPYQRQGVVAQVKLGGDRGSGRQQITEGRSSHGQRRAEHSG